MKRTLTLVGLVAVGAVLIGAASWIAGTIAPSGYCNAIGQEIARLEARKVRGSRLSLHERDNLAHWYAERAQRCGIPKPLPAQRPRVMYL